MYCIKCGTECEYKGVIPTYHIGPAHTKHVCPKCGWTNDRTPIPNETTKWVYEDTEYHAPDSIHQYRSGPPQECLAEACAEGIRKAQGLPPGASVPVHIVCPCPKCQKVKL